MDFLNYRAFANTTFGLDKETTIKVYKQNIRPEMNYASTASASNLSKPCKSFKTKPGR